ncbi:aspartic peptidase A1 [Lentinula edodes]|uniref:aspartic peptidase A1 n=1 Tax=Lentinula edodes TaxID=5353 RepID=UPI001E8DD5ED|nr:aspartic peptidase A1 [Lentinula edodes]KAH7878512.1 aspartic peptidase A1 [Lentinula edodes]
MATAHSLGSMPFFATLFALCVTTFPTLAGGLSPSPFIVPVQRLVNTPTTGHSLVRAGQARLQAFSKAHSQVNGIPGDHAALAPPAASLTDQIVTFTINPVVNGKNFSLIVDTGSSNTWVGADPANRLQPGLGLDLFEVTYGSGAVLGDETTNTVNITPGLAVENQSIGNALLSEGFDGVDGIMGFGPVDLTQGTLLDNAESTIPTVMDNLFAQGTISNETLGVFLAPTTTDDPVNGELSFGGVDTSKMTGPMSFFQSTLPFWSISQSATFGGVTIMDTTTCVVDTGTTLLMLPEDAVTTYQDLIGATLDPTTGLLSINEAQLSNLTTLSFIGTDINGETQHFDLTPNAQLFPRAFNTEIGGSADDILLITASSGSNDASTIDCIMGQSFLQRTYSAFVTPNGNPDAAGTVGFATTPFTDATTN